jgi:outer membrane protein
MACGVRLAAAAHGSNAGAGTSSKAPLDRRLRFGLRRRARWRDATIDPKPNRRADEVCLARKLLERVPMRPITLPALLLFALFSLHAGTADAQVIDGRDTGNTLGVGVLWGTEPYVGVDNDVFVFPTITWQIGRVFVRETGLGFQIAGDEHWSVDGFAEWRFEGYDADDSDFLDGMDDRDGTLDAGIAYVRRSETFGKFAFSIGADTLDRHGGYQADITWSKLTSFGVPSVRVAYYSSSLADYYFGVEANEAAPGRPAYAPGSSLIWNVNHSIGAPINKNWNWVANVGADFYPSDVSDSPIVDDDYRAYVFLGASYIFR